MFSTARLHLTGWYLLILSLIVGLLSIALYRLVHQVQQADLLTNQPQRHHFLAHLFAHESTTLAWQIIAVDAALLILGAFGAYLLAGRTLRPLEMMAERQRRFAAAASHELRTPLTALRGNVEVALLQQRSLDEYEAVLRKTVATTERLTKLVQDLTLLARPTADAALIGRQEIDLNEVARDAAEEVRLLANTKKQNLSVELGGPLRVQGDPLKLEQVIVNLLDNAITYTPAGGSISLLARRDRGRAVLTVQDSGPGITPDHLPRLFEPFYQVNAAGGAGHVGLGLALADWSVRAHRGKLEVESKPGSGTAFTLSLPLADASRPAPFNPAME